MDKDRGVRATIVVNKGGRGQAMVVTQKIDGGVKIHVVGL